MKIRRGVEKRWGCLFPCLVTRAIHLELADSLSTDDFLLCLRNFIGRRGHPFHMHSDNGTNFKGADAELKQCLEDLGPVSQSSSQAQLRRVSAELETCLNGDGDEDGFLGGA